jgi:hypothetical protein
MLSPFAMALGGLPLATGKGVRVAILDSGLNPQWPLLKGFQGKMWDCRLSAEGLRLRTLPEGVNSDVSGHGSVVQSCVMQLAPQAQCDHFRILAEDNTCEASLLCYVMDAVLEQGYSIVHLSLGIRSEEHIPWLVSIAKRAYERSSLVVAAASNLGNSLYPARFTSSISVEADDLESPLCLRFRPANVVEFAAKGVEVSVPSGEGQSKTVSGSSYAAAYVTGLCARILEISPQSSPWDVKVRLREYALQNQAKTIASNAENTKGELL